jgi:hypothetical protein
MTGTWTFTAAFATKTEADEFHLTIWRHTGIDTVKRGNTVHVRGISHAERGYAKNVANRIAMGLVGDAEVRAGMLAAERTA